MKAGEVVLQQLLNGTIQYRVPLFQRTYSWDAKRWERLWDDLLDIYSMERPRNHFIGSIVTQPIPDAPERAAKFMLIDGQQRLTTLCLILGAIRQKASEQSEGWPELSQEIEDMCLVNKYAAGEEERFKLRPTQGDRESFAAALRGGTPSPSTQIGRAWTYFRQALEEGDPNGSDIDLRRLKNCITSYLDLVSIKLEQEDSPNRIFESLNNTGMRLSVTDLIRNYLFMNIRGEPAQQEAYETLWYPMEMRLSDEGYDYASDFFWRYLMMEGKLPRFDETFNVIKELVGNADSDKVLHFLEEFSRFSKYYCRLAELDRSEPDGPFLSQIVRLNQWEVDVAYPFFMAALERVHEGDISEAQFVDVARMVESFVIRRVVCGVPTNRLRSIFAQMKGGVDFSDFINTSHQYLLNNDWPTDDEFTAAFVRFRLYSPARLSRTRLVLTSLERSFGSKETPEMGPNITIEHIMPQTLSTEWRAMLGSRATEVHPKWLDTVGNLTLSGYNPDLGNKPFSEKTRLLLDSNFALSKGLREYEVWDEVSIEKRGKGLALRAAQVWRQ